MTQKISRRRQTRIQSRTDRRARKRAARQARDAERDLLNARDSLARMIQREDSEDELAELLYTRGDARGLSDCWDERFYNEAWDWICFHEFSVADCEAERQRIIDEMPEREARRADILRRRDQAFGVLDQLWGADLGASYQGYGRILAHFYCGSQLEAAVVSIPDGWDYTIEWVAEHGRCYLSASEPERPAIELIAAA